MNRVRTVPPAGNSADDEALLGALQAVELAAWDLYVAAISGGGDDDVYVGIRDNHRAYADLLSGLLGRAAPDARDQQLYDAQLAGFESSGTDLATAAYDLESALVATHGDVLGQLVGADGARAIAAVLMAEARHCAVLADLAGLGDDFTALFDNQAAPLALAGEGQG